MGTHSFVCVDSFFFSVNRTVKSLIGEVFQLLELTPSTCERYVLKLCDSEEYLQRSVPDLTALDCGACIPALPSAPQTCHVFPPQ